MHLIFMLPAYIRNRKEESEIQITVLYVQREITCTLGIAC